MFSYPVRVPIPRRQLPGKPTANFVRKWGERIADYINERAKNYSTIPLSYEQIARDTHIRKEIVEAFLTPLGGGYIGITIHNPQLENNREAYRKPS